MENKIIGEYINILPQKDLSKLPKAWVLTKVGEICSCEKNKGQEGAIPYLEIGNINILTKKYFPGEKPTVRSAFLSRKGDILISRVRPTRGAVTITLEEELHVSSALTVLRPLLGIPSKFLHYFLAWNQTFFKFLGENSTGTMYPTVKEDFILEYPIPLPPLSEQYRIVAKIEELFTKLDAGVELLKKVKKQLKLYRQAVLKHAFEGKLTEEWRKVHKDELEPASVLLDRIKEERKNSTKREKAKYKELPPMEVPRLPKLPEGWVGTRLGNITKIILGQSPPSSTYNENKNGFPFYQGKLNFNDVFPTPRKWCIAPKKIAENGDVLICVRAPVGPTNICQEKSCIGRGLAAIRSICGMKSFFIFYLLRAFEKEISGKGTGTTFNAITGDQLKQIFVPLAPLQEQHKIVEEIERRFSTADEVEKIAEQSLKQAEKLRQSILKRAFEGKLVPQDPNDELATILLEKIEKEKARIEAEKKAKKVNKKKKTKVDPKQGRLL